MGSTSSTPVKPTVNLNPNTSDMGTKIGHTGIVGIQTSATQVAPASNVNLSPITSNMGTNIGHTGIVGLQNLYIKDTTTGVTTQVAIPEGITGIAMMPSTTSMMTPTTHTATKLPVPTECANTLADKLMTKVMIEAAYPAFKWDPAHTWTAEEMECWAWLATKSGDAHPDRVFSQVYGFEPYMI